MQMTRLAPLLCMSPARQIFIATQKRYVMYKEISAISYAIRAYICYLTIETTPIFDNEGLTWLFGQIISIYTLFYLISYAAVGALGLQEW